MLCRCATVCRAQRQANYATGARPSYSVRTMNTRTAATYLSRYLVALLWLDATHAMAQLPPTAAGTGSSNLDQKDGLEPTVRRYVMQHTDSLGRRCTLKDAAVSGAMRFVACGSAGLWVCKLNPDGTVALVATNDVGGSADGFFVQDNRLWLEISSVRAQRLELPVHASEALAQSNAEAPSETSEPGPVAAGSETPAGTTSTGADGPTSASSAPTARALAGKAANALARLAQANAQSNEVTERGRVVRAERRSVIVAGTEGLHAGDHVAFYEPTSRADSEFGEAAPPIAVGRVAVTIGDRARVELGMNEHVPVASEAVRTPQPLSSSSFAPRRAGGLWEVGFLARPFIVLDNLGFGVFADVRVGYRFAGPLHVEAALSPLGFATAKGGAAVPVAGVVSAAYDSQLFEVGLGLGGQTVNWPDLSIDPGSGTTVAQRLRLGARDGAHLEAISYVSLFHSEFRFSTLRVSAQIPVGGRAWLLASGGGGNLGLAHGELGLRVLLSGNGNADSFFLTTVVGAVETYKQRCNVVIDGECDSIDYFGPMVGAGGEWRL